VPCQSPLTYDEHRENAGSFHRRWTSLADEIFDGSFDLTANPATALWLRILGEKSSGRIR
jgi:hypothetical protein